MYVMANNIWDFPEIPRIRKEVNKSKVVTRPKENTTPVYLHKTESSIFSVAELLLRVNVPNHQLIEKYSFCFGFALSAIKIEVENSPILVILHFVCLLKM